MRYIRTKDGKLFDLKKIKDEIKNDEVSNVFYRDYRFKKPEIFNGYGGRGLIIGYTYKGKCNVDFIKENKTYGDSVFLECDPDGYRESDDVTDLFDEIIWVWNKEKSPHMSTLRQYERCGGYGDLCRSMRYELNWGHNLGYDYKVYGAIWTDKGLLYVAELTQNGKKINGKWKVL